jgi:ABC-type transport system substrate-binding protein
MPFFACLVALLLTVPAPLVPAQPTQITIAQPAEATTMDPGRSAQVYDSHTRWDTALQLQPGLATSWKALNETAWEFTLRPGVKFHDGARLTAEDVRATIERNRVPGKTVVIAGSARRRSAARPVSWLARVPTRARGSACSGEGCPGPPSRDS